MHCRDPALPSPIDDGLRGAHALQRRADELHRKLSEEPRSVVSVDLCHKLRRAAVELHEDGLLGQRRSKVLRSSEAVAAEGTFCLPGSCPTSAHGLYELLNRHRLQSEWTLTTRTSQSVVNQNGSPTRMGAPLELIRELDSSIVHSTDQRKSVMLRHLTDLFLVGPINIPMMRSTSSTTSLSGWSQPSNNRHAHFLQSASALYQSPHPRSCACLPATTLSTWPPLS